MSTPTAAKVLFEDSKFHLTERVQSNVNGLGLLARQVLKGARSQQTLGQAAKNFAAQDSTIYNSEINLSKMQTLVASMQIQTTALQKHVHMIPALKKQMEQMNL
ncbi:BLOC-1-related complex subunit 7-like isoform X2 [Varroa jacobsoni]|nr:BLOC-1-related complex subunit 7-like isoform X2 [Varroa destructor]XP_022693286.1 BLOC-1-related complex subunit 7-like isoform X2 [Varroa jacobsoni]